jgi:hypothetical protein
MQPSRSNIIQQKIYTIKMSNFTLITGRSGSTYKGSSQKTDYRVLTEGGAVFPQIDISGKDCAMFPKRLVQQKAPVALQRLLAID